MNIIETSYKWAYIPGNRITTTHLILHHAAAYFASAQTIHGWHLGNGWAGIAYHYYVRKDGSIYRGRPEYWSGGHTSNWNHCSIGICFEGNFDAETMPAAQAKAGAVLVANIKTRYPGIIVGRHRDYNSTVCPGRNFPFYEIVSYKVPETDKNGCPYGTSTELVKVGSTGEHVKRCQWYLRELGYNLGIIDGECNSHTVAGIIKFQIAKGLNVDGICDARTWAALESALYNAKEDEDMTDERFAELMNKYRSNLKDNDSSTWSEEARQWAIDTELFVGSGTTASGDPNYMWEDLLTREEAVTLMYRLARLLGKA